MFLCLITYPDSSSSGRTQRWQRGGIMFIAMGVVTIGIGILTFFVLPDTPMEASWLKDSEKVALLKHISVNQTGVEQRKFRWAEIWEAPAGSSGFG